MGALSRGRRKGPVNCNRGFASAEVMILLGVLVVIASIIVPAIRYSRQQALIELARLDIIDILDAGRRYNEDYKKWPSEFAGEYGDYRYGYRIPNAHVFNVLRAIDGEGNPRHAVNERKIPYINPLPAGERSPGIDEDGNWVDPWGRPYQVVVDTDLNNTCNIDRSTYKPQIGHGMVVWSSGPDRKSETDDDILSWELSE